ncbi:MAG: YhcN/YlaJ family sporulation lipoprotein [Clostridia bacterium]|nr:YhcN/YlaJ family sporulation lipoprotein [Clostridia bacterium]
MKRRFPIIIPIFVGIGLLAFLFFSSNMFGRNNQRPGQYGTTQQGRNLIGENMQGTNPNTGIKGDNLGTELGNPPNEANLETTPGPSNNAGFTKVDHPRGFDVKKAENIRNQLGNIEGVRQINTVVNGDTVLIGYSPTDTTRDTNAARNAITDRVKQFDKSIKSVIVSDSTDISSRIGGLEDKIKNNRITNDLNLEFNQLMRSIRPAGQ